MILSKFFGHLAWSRGFVLLLSCTALSLPGGSVQAQETGSFLRNPADAKALSLAGAGIVSLDEVSVFDNAALSPFSLSPISVNASVMSWQKETYDGGASAYSASARYSSGKVGTFYVGARMLKKPPFEQTDDYGNVLGSSTSPKDLAVEAGYARTFCDDFSASFTARYLRLDPGYGSTADAVSFDAGLGYRHKFQSAGPLSDVAGIVQIKNFGTSPDYGYGRRSLPWMVNAGASAGLLAGKYHRFRAGASVDVSVAPSHKGRDEASALSPVRGASVSVGAEYSYRSMVYARGGYRIGSGKSGEPSYAAAGLGIRLWHLTIDGSWLFAAKSSPLHNTAAGTLTLWF